MTQPPTTCALHGDAGCYLPFAKCKRPKYVYEKHKVRNDAGVTCTVAWCVGVHPKPRPVTEAKCRQCPDWRDSAGRDAETVARLGEHR